MTATPPNTTASSVKSKIAYMGTTQIVMPENYIAMFGVPQADEARAIVAKAEPDIHRAIAYIAAAQAFPPPRNGPCDRLMSTAGQSSVLPAFLSRLLPLLSAMPVSAVVNAFGAVL